MASDSVVKIVGSLKSKTEKKMDDCCTSITSLRLGTCSGDQGPFIFLTTGKMTDRGPTKDLEKHFGCPPGSAIIPSPSAFMTDDVWLQLVLTFAKGIHAIPVIKDHPDWWVTVSCDGFGSHVNVHLVQHVFHDHKILIIKEEGNTLHVNQAYDQSVAKADKALMRQHLEVVHKSLGSTRINQWYLIAVAIHSQKMVDKQKWIDSFIKVNMHPKHQLTFDNWIKKLNQCGVLVTCKKFFEKQKSLYDAMRKFS